MYVFACLKRYEELYIYYRIVYLQNTVIKKNPSDSNVINIGYHLNNVHRYTGLYFSLKFNILNRN